MKIRNLPSDILQFGLAFVFMYAAVQIIINYQSFVGYVPEFVFNFVPVPIFMYVFASLEIVLGLWIISGKKLVHSALVAAGLMLTITLFNIELFIVLFRNIAILCGALALAAMSYKRNITISIDPTPDQTVEIPTHQEATIEQPPIQTPSPTPTQQPIQPQAPLTQASTPATATVNTGTE